ncbi:SGNH/GDSL hydrolase family protein [Sphingobium sp. CCH11-B1]|uniref:SGNH/GDSL hydrolase family protein n=1 Tax=Sphingobium sp. CCH11-B1 TaxID=1768781 RepID=UPI00082E410F|nr:SGNH/GDSL hydrolase family protein [Sphingobium sp. CCH11-B1]
MALNDVKRLVVTTALATPLAGKADADELTAEVSRATSAESALDTRLDTVEAALPGKATAAQGALADSAVQPGDFVDVLAETPTAKIMSSAERAKLAGIAAGATANAPDAELLDRENHTGTQPIATVAGLQDALDDESDARVAGDQAEFDRATGAEATLSEAITNEAARALTQEQSLSARQTRSERQIVDINETFEQGDDPGVVFVVADETGRKAMDVTEDRTLRTGAIAVERSAAIGTNTIEDSQDDGAYGPFVVVDPAGRVVEPIERAGHILIRTIPGYVGDGDANDSVALAKARDRARTLGLRYVDLQGTTAYAPDLTSDGNVHFVNGVVSGRYGKRGAPLHRPAPFTGLGDLDAARHLPTFSAAAAPVAVLVGDSTATIYADGLQVRDCLSGMLEERLRRAVGSKTLTFYNRAIGGQTWQTFNSGPGYTPPYVTNALYSWWYTDANRDWLDYVEDLAPDLIVMHFGINDRQNIDHSAIKSVLAKIAAWAKVPDIVFTTPPQPQSDQAIDYMTDVEQDGRDMAAGLMRTMAGQLGYGLLDFNRTYNLRVRGIDPVETSLVTAFEVQTVALPFEATAIYRVNDEAVRGAVRDYAAQIDISSLTSTTFATPLRFRLSGHGGGLDNDLLLWRHASGKFAWNVRMAGSDMLFASDQVSTVDCPTSGTVSLRFQLSSGGHVRLGIAGPYVEDPIVNQYLTRFGGVFRPAIAGSAATSALLSLWLGRELVYTPSHNSREIWGDPNSPIAKQQPLGGNGVNHPTDLGAHIIYGPALDAARFV